MGSVTLILKPCAAAGKPTGDVAYFRMPLALSAMDAMNRCIERAYGKDCVCTEEPQGWLKVSTPNVMISGGVSPSAAVVELGKDNHPEEEKE